jgi:hypothetical protein
MKPNESQSSLPASVAQKLRSVRRREFAIIWLGGLTRTLVVLVGAMLVAMAIDRIVGWFDPGLRSVSTTVALVAVVVAFAIWCVRPLMRRGTLAATAREIDESMPQLEERWSTVTELSENTDAREVRGSEAMIRKVASEAESANSAINPRAVVPARPVTMAGRWLAGAMAVLALWFAVSFTEAKVLLQRFWLPAANISLTRVTATPGTTWVPKGEPVTLVATIDGRRPSGPAKLFIRNGQGTGKETAMTAKAAETAAFQYTIDEVADSFEFRVRSGDGQTPWHRITAVERPNISAVKLTVQPPAYSRLPREEKDALPSLVRVLDSSEVDVGFKADQPLDRLQVDLGNGQAAQLSADPDGWYHFRSRPTESFSLTASAINKYALENKHKPTCRISVYDDLPPSIKVLDPSDDVEVLPGEKVKVSFEASDDFGLAKAEVVVATTTADGKTENLTIPVPLEADAGKKQVRKAVELDPKALGLKHGDQLTYSVRVTDTKEKFAEGVADAKASPQANQQTAANASASPANAASKEAEAATAEAKEALETQAELAAQAATAAQEQANASGKPQDPSTAAAANNGSPQQAQSQQAQSSAAKPGEANAQQAKAEQAKAEQANAQQANESQTTDQQESTLASAAKQQPASAKPQSGQQPPPNEMTKRTLDAGQSSECSPRNITVDEYAGTFDGEKRQKLEIAIDPVLKQLEALLATAQEKTDSLKPPAASTEGLQQTHAEPLNHAKGKLKESIDVTADLKGRTAGTPYAFVGLQVHNIGQAHTTPAQRSLGEVAFDAPKPRDNVPPIDKASFHITQAREMLAALTKNFESIKREQKIADAMQKLNKMYQIFIEDTQALLGGKKPPINSYNRKVAEVDEEFVAKLKELMEAKKKIMEELAKVLGEDPRMLRRYLAMMQLQGTSYRDQMTLLAERQKQLREQVSGWNGIGEAERWTLIEGLEKAYAPLQRQVVVDATKLRENMETWLPLDVKPEDKMIEAALNRAERIVQFATEGTGPSGPHATPKALAELHSLRESLPAFSQIESKDQAKMTAYIANRLSDVESLITAQSGQMKIADSLERGDFPKVAEIVQHRITQETATLGQKLEAVGQQVGQMSDEIAEKADLLNTIVQGGILAPQQTSVDEFAARNTRTAGDRLDAIVPTFAIGEEAFDELMRLIIAKMDEAPPPGTPTGAPPQLEDLLAMLENEMKAAEGLGIPCRPINVMMMTDWMKPGQGSSSGQGMGVAQAQAAQAQARQGQAESDRLGKEARERARKALADARKNADTTAAEQPPTEKPAKGRSEAWNKLASRLEKDLLQGRDNVPPEQYRAAIESYFKTISEATSAAGK